MKVGVELRCMTMETSGGVVPLLAKLLPELVAIAPEIHFHFFATPFNSRLVPSGANVTCHVLPLDRPWKVLDSIAASEAVDLVVRAFPGYDELSFPLRRQIVLVPDAQHEFYPEFFSKEDLRERRRNFSRLIRGCAAIGTISDYSRRTIEEIYSEFTFDIFLIPPAGYFDPKMPVDPVADERIAKLEPFFFFPANLWGHKNHETLLKSFSRFRALGSPFDQFRLVLTGHLDDAAKLAKHFDTRNVVHLGYVTAGEMASLYRHATGLLFFSLFEGFGMPVLEAFGFGCPVACSNVTSLPEIAGDAALMCDPLDQNAIVDLMRKLASEPETRAQLAAAGRERFRAYSWRPSAENMREALHRVEQRLRTTTVKVGRSSPLVSIVTPSYNQAPFLRRTIESVLGQDYPHIEYKVIDGNSTDGSLEILKSYGARLNWSSEPDFGQTHAINKGLSSSKGTILAYLNADDTLEPGTISTIVDFFSRHPETDLAYGDANYIDIDDRVTGKYPTAQYSFDRMMFDCCICQPAAFWTSHIARRVGPFDETLDLAMDYEYWLRIDRFGSVINYLPTMLANSRRYSGTKTSSQRRNIYSEIFEIARKHGGYVSRNYVMGYWNHRLWQEPHSIDKLLRLVSGMQQKLVEADMKRLATPQRAWSSYLGNKVAAASWMFKGPSTPSRELQHRRKVLGFGADGWLRPEVSISGGRPNGPRRFELSGWSAVDMRLEIEINKCVAATYDLKANALSRIELPEWNGELALRFDSFRTDHAGNKLSFRIQYTDLFGERDL